MFTNKTKINELKMEVVKRDLEIDSLRREVIRLTESNSMLEKMRVQDRDFYRSELREMLDNKNHKRTIQDGIDEFMDTKEEKEATEKNATTLNEFWSGWQDLYENSQITYRGKPVTEEVEVNAKTA